MDAVAETHEPENQPSGQVRRRGFLTKAGAVLFGALAGFVPLVSGVLFFLDPLRQRGGGSEFIKVTSLATLPADGQPARFAVVADRVDAWNRFPGQPIGAVFLSRASNGEVLAFNVTCPHLGCPVDFVPAEQCYHCPCHDSSFLLTGQPKNKIPPRGLDSLEVDPAKLKAGEVWVKFQNFETGHAEKKPKA